MKKIFLVAGCLLAMLTSCDENAGSIGSTLTKVEDLVHISDDVFDVRSGSVVPGSVLSNSIDGYLGKVKDPETGVYVTADYMTQFGWLDNTVPFSAKEYIVNKDAQGRPVADSCDIRLFFKSYYGDSLSVVKITVHELSKRMHENVKYYSDFDPITNGYVRTTPGGVKVEKAYTIIDRNLSDSLRNTSSFVKNIQIYLDKEYTDPKDPTNIYNNYGSYIINQYYEHPEYFKNSLSFIDKVCPGFYFQVTGGVGSMAYVYQTQLVVYYTVNNNGKNVGTYTRFVGTEEVLQTTHIQNDNYVLNLLAENTKCTYVKSPAGVFTELTLPVDDYISESGNNIRGIFNAEHANDTLSSAKIEIPCIYSQTETSQYALDAPSTLLMVQADSLTSYFEKGKIIDYRTSFEGKYQSTTNSYVFDNVAGMIQTMRNIAVAETRKNPNWKQSHPNWNKVYLVPVSYEKDVTNSSISRVYHDMTLGSARLVRGTDASPLKMSVIYSRFNN